MIAGTGTKSMTISKENSYLEQNAVPSEREKITINQTFNQNYVT